MGNFSTSDYQESRSFQFLPKLSVLTSGGRQKLHLIVSQHVGNPPFKINHTRCYMTYVIAFRVSRSAHKDSHCLELIVRSRTVARLDITRKNNIAVGYSVLCQLETTLNRMSLDITCFRDFRMHLLFFLLCHLHRAF